MNSIKIQGNILNFDVLDRITQNQEVFQAPKDYGFTNKTEILSALESNWGVIKSQYKTFQKKLDSLKENSTGTTETRRYWMETFLFELGYEIELNKKSLIVDERTYPISHNASNLGGFPIHIIGANLSLDKKYSGHRMSAHAMVQEYLNHNENLYAIVTNGKTLRLLRDAQLLTKISYVEFDLIKLIEEDQFADFVLLWKLLHFSRMPKNPDKGAEAIIEQYHLNSLESGSRIRDKLSEAVKHGILKLANGLIQEEKNDELRDWLTSNNNVKLYYGELLRLIYRILFIFVIEERDLIYPSKLDEKTQRLKAIYYENYSLQRLKTLALQYYYGNDQNYDLWAYMTNIFELYETSKGEKLGIRPLAGDLFSYDAIGNIRQCQLNNDVLLQVFKGLSLFENNQGQYIAVNYKALDVEEFGSVYEGLLELDPAIDIVARRFNFVQGDERSISGAHYTPDELVQPLIKHSLEHLIQDILKLKVNADTKVQKLLQLTVCDVACGSGHILLAAARRIGLEVARLRTDEEQPNPYDTRKGIRDAIQNCIYGVDKNPLAVELCKVAMWLEAHVPGKPLNFLDHKIKNGDAIVGLAHLEELYNGIPTEAFKNLSGFSKIEKENCAAMRKSNKKQRGFRIANNQLRVEHMKGNINDRLKQFRKKFEAFRNMPETNAEEIKAKQKAYHKLNSGSNWWFVKSMADLQVAQFFVDKSDVTNIVTDNEYFDVMAGRQKYPKAESLALAEATKRKFFHWFLEFPEVFSEGGFSVVLGNPPFLGGGSISAKIGINYNFYIKELYVNAFNLKTNKGQSDLVAYFLRRNYKIINKGGFVSLITTNSISQGDTKSIGIDYVRSIGAEIIFANTSINWSGRANVVVSQLSVFKGENFFRDKWLNGQIVDTISTSLSNNELDIKPQKLISNKDLSFEGSKVYGKGFLLSPEEAQNLYSISNNNYNVILPYLSGTEVTQEPLQTPQRYAINFQDWDLEKCQKYIKVFDIVLKKVKPERDALSNNSAWNKAIKKKWWLHGAARMNLYHIIKGLDRVLVQTRVTRTHGFIFVPNNFIFADSLTVVALDEYKYFVFLQNSFHESWAWIYGSSMKNDRRYTPASCFQTFPFPQSLSEKQKSYLEYIGETYHDYRKKLMMTIQLGLTKTYNQFHNQDLEADGEKDINDKSQKDIKKLFAKETWNLYNHLQKTENAIAFAAAIPKIEELRELHIQMDKTVLEAYGWHQNSKRWGEAIDLRHDFYEVDYLPENDRVRYTIHPEARKEVLKRLLLLNHEIHESEERNISYEELDREKIIDIYREEVSDWIIDAKVPHTKTIKYLAYAEDIFPDLDGKDIKEYSPYVAEICKAIENELLQKVFIPFNDAFQEKWKDESEEDKNNYLKSEVEKAEKVGGLVKHLKKDDVKYTLGTMHFLLNMIQSSKSKTVKNSPLLQELKAFTFGIYDNHFLNKKTMQEIDELTKLYRNASAHADEKYESELKDIDKAKAIVCRDEVRRIINVIIQSELNVSKKK